MQRHVISTDPLNQRKLKLDWLYRMRNSKLKNIVTKIAEIQDIGNVKSYSVKEIVEKVNRVMDKSVEIKSSLNRFREENMGEYADISQIKSI